MKFTKTFWRWIALMLALGLSACAVKTSLAPPQPGQVRVTVLYDAFGKDPAMAKDWGYAALVEVNGKKILFDTGNDDALFAKNVKAKGIDLSTIDFVVMSHRHGDHMAGLNQVLAANPKVKIYGPQEGFGIYGASLPSSFYRKNDQLPPEMRYYDGKPPATMVFGAAWPHANFVPIDKTTQIAPGITLIALVSDVPGTRELKELSLAIDTPDGVVLLVGCSHPGIENIVQEASKINPNIQLIAGGFHMVNATDAVIAKVATSLRDTWKVQNIAPGHCTGEPTFAGLQASFGQRYLYAGVGVVLQLEKGRVMGAAQGPAALMGESEMAVYAAMAQLSPDARDTHLAHKH